MSVFEPVYYQSSENEAFWVEVHQLSSDPTTKPAVFRENLQFSYNGQDEATYEVTLSSSFLYFYPEIGRAVAAKIKLRLVEAFIEEHAELVRYGFRIPCLGHNYDFYVENSCKLDSWLNCLSEVALMDSFEEEYVIIKDIDSGHFGSVSLCRCVETHQEYAVKIIKRTTLCNKKSLNQLYNEISILKRIDHPNIIKLYKVFQNSESIFLLMEYIPFGNLYHRMKVRRRFSEQDVLAFSRTLFQVLVYLSSKRIIHRDLKLENILMSSKTSDCEFKLADFGLSCYADSAIKSCSGSPGYMAPEVLRGAKICTKSDVFSAGVVIYTMLSGMSPFLAPSINEVVRRNARCEIKYKMNAFRGISKVAIGFLGEILHHNPQIRPNAREALKSDWFSYRSPKDSENTGIQLESTPMLRVLN